MKSRSKTPRALSAVVLATACSFALATAAATPAAKPTGPAPTVLGEEPLAPGQFAWLPQMSAGGPLLVLVNLKEQMAYVYRNGLRIGRSSVSTGKKGHETPTGVFTILQKNKDHRSNIYNNAPMPYMQRLTWDGIALHAGNLPGYPASHGCVRLPYAFSKLLFGVTTTGVTVVVAQDHAAPAVVSGELLSGDGLATPQAQRAEAGSWSWNPERAPQGNLTVVLSEPQELAIVLRNGVEIGRAHVALNGAPLPGTTTYVLMQGQAATASKLVPDRPALNWMAVGDGSQPDRMEPLAAELAARISLPQEFARKVYEELRRGATVVIANEALHEADDEELTVLRADEDAPVPPPEEAAPAATK
jgi:lipoprotein-anchoring transpeptidase ErfK/SrfK